jgi:RND family efflux transporter MFP subunit
MATRRQWIGTTVKTLLSLALLGAIIAWLSGWLHDKTPPGRVESATYERGLIKAQVEQRQTPRVTATVGTVRAVHESTVASRLLARVTKVHVTAGQAVDAGDLLVELDQRDIDAQVNEAAANVNAAQARLTKARSDLEQIQQLIAGGATTQRELDNAKRGVEVATAELESRRHALEQTQAQLQYTRVTAPIGGIIIDKHVEEGDLAQPGKPLVTLYDPNRLQLVASVPESLAVTLQIGQAVGVRLDALDLDCQASISEIVPQADPRSRAMLVKVTGPCPPGVYSGMFGRMLIQHGTQTRLLVPQTAVRRVGQLEMVEVDEGQMRSRRFVRTGETIGDKVEILSGLAADETINAVFGNQP